MTREELLRHLEAAARPDPARVLDALLEVSGAERGFVVLRENGELAVHTARHMDGEEIAHAREKVSRTILERALAEGKPMVASDAEIAGSASLQQQKVRSVCALPLRSCEGAVYLDHRFGKARFDDLEFLGAFADLMDAALKSARELAARRGGAGLVGNSAPMKDLARLLGRVIAAPYPVLIVGESGTGKELVAQAIHRRGARSGGPFVAVNCAVFSETLLEAELFGHAKGAFTGADHDRAGVFEQAQGGVLFLDEIACLSAGAQEAFLRVLETSEVRRVGGTRAERVDVRVVAATNEDLTLSGSFRRDLYYRLNVLRLDLPPLRDRKEDIPALAEHFLGRIALETQSDRKALSPAARAALADHRWPGNVRELENALRRAAAMTDARTLEAGDFIFLKERTAGAEGAIVSLDDHIRRVLLQWGDKLDLQEIAGKLGISRKTLWERKKQLGL